MNKLDSEMNRIKKKWIVDECPDAHGNWTIRIDNGDTEAAIVATVYGLALAETIVAEHNSLKSH